MTEKCINVVEKHFNNIMQDLKTLWNAKDNKTKALGNLNEYALCLDFVESGTFNDQKKAYIRYQISWGGPSEEFRIFEDGSVEFWFLDWFDGAKADLNSEDCDLIKQIVCFENFTFVNQ